MVASGAGLPDLTFNEMRFLERPQHHDLTEIVDITTNGAASKRSKADAEISAYFTAVQPTIARDRISTDQRSAKEDAVTSHGQQPVFMNENTSHEFDQGSQAHGAADVSSASMLLPELPRHLLRSSRPDARSKEEVQAQRAHREHTNHAGDQPLQQQSWQVPQWSAMTRGHLPEHQRRTSDVIGMVSFGNGENVLEVVTPSSRHDLANRHAVQRPCQEPMHADNTPHTALNGKASLLRRSPQSPALQANEDNEPPADLTRAESYAGPFSGADGTGHQAPTYAQRHTPVGRRHQSAALHHMAPQLHASFTADPLDPGTHVRLWQDCEHTTAITVKSMHNVISLEHNEPALQYEMRHITASEHDQHTTYEPSIGEAQHQSSMPCRSDRLHHPANLWDLSFEERTDLPFLARSRADNIDTEGLHDNSLSLEPFWRPNRLY